MVLLDLFFIEGSSAEDLMKMRKYKKCLLIYFMLKAWLKSLSRCKNIAKCLLLHIHIILTVNGLVVISELNSKLPSKRTNVSPAILKIIFLFLRWGPCDRFPFPRVKGAPGFRRRAGSPATPKLRNCCPRGWTLWRMCHAWPLLLAFAAIHRFFF